MGNNGPDQGQTLAAADRWRTDGTKCELAMLIEVRGGRSRYFSVPQSPIYCSLSSPPLLCSSAPAPPPPPGRTQQAVRLGLLCESTDCSCPCTSARCVCGWRAGKGEDGESKRGLGGRLLEATDIATKDNKMLKEEVLSNTAWSSTTIMRTDSLKMVLVMYGSTDWCSSAPSTCPSSPSCRACRVGGDRRGHRHGDASDGGRHF